MNAAKQYSRQIGFTLLELSIVVGVISIVMGGILVFARDMVTKRQAIDTELRIEEIVLALDQYYALNGHLPCPASRSDIQSSASLGREVNSGNCTYTTAPAGTLRVETVASSGVWVLVGVLPAKALSLSNEIIRDGYGNRFSYVVMQSLTEASTFSAGTGALIIKDGSANDIITNGAYAIISHGEDGKGAYNFATGALNAACSATNMDLENCDWDATFIDAPYNDGSVAANYFDDIIRWKSRLSY